MFRALFRNTVISAAAYFVASITGLLLVPVLIQAYGLVLFGLIVLARSFLPYGVLGLFDWGFSELTAQAVARARVDKKWDHASQQLGFILLIATSIAVLLAVTLWLAAPTLAKWLQTPSEHIDSFSTALQITGLSLLIVFPGLVLDGIAKGFEHYRLLRGAEVSSNLAYAGGAVLCVYAGLPYWWIIYIFLASLLLRIIPLLIAAIKMGKAQGLRISLPQAADRSELLQRLRAMAFNRSIGTMERQGVPPVIGVLLGPAASGAYDVLVRIPRFLKAIVGLLSSALLPIAARLEASEDADGMRRLGSYTLLTSAVVTLPLLGATAVCSEPILRLWVGPNLAADWYWQALIFVDPAASAIIGAGATALIVREAAFARLNIVSAWRLLLQYAISFGSLPWLAERGFILGQAVAILIAFSWQLRIIRQEQDLPSHIVRKLWNVLLLGALWMLIGLSIQRWVTIDTWVTTAAFATLWAFVYQLSIYRWVFSKPERQRIVMVVAHVRRPPSPKDST